MRLTLRTLLAYMDDILEPDDAQEIAKKIAESPVATELMHRIRDVMRRLRLGAPSVLDRGEGLDPNTVAEYLDNTLSDAQVPDFEKICLESDVQLAEVASCHRILALVLGEPAEVDPSGREKAYRLASAPTVAPELQSQAAPPAVPAEAPAESPLGTGESAATPAKSRIPDYLREPPQVRRRRWGILALAAVVLIGVALLALSGRLGGRNLLAELLGMESPVTEGEQGKGTENPPVPGGPAVAPFPGTTGPAEGTPPGPAASSPKGPAVPPAKEPAIGPPPMGKGPPAPGEGPIPGKPRADASDQAPPSGTAFPDMPVPPEPKPQGPNAMGVAKPRPGAGDLAGPDVVAPPGGKGGDSGAKPPQPIPDPKGPASTPKPSRAQRVGHLVSTKEVVLRPKTQAGDWRYVAGQADLFAGDRLLSLPAFRPVLALGGRAKVQLLDGASVELLAPDATSAVGLSIEFGKVLLKAEEVGGAPIRIQLGDRTALVTFQDAESTLAIDARRQEVPARTRRRSLAP